MVAVQVWRRRSVPFLCTGRTALDASPLFILLNSAGRQSRVELACSKRVTHSSNLTGQQNSITTQELHLSLPTFNLTFQTWPPLLHLPASLNPTSWTSQPTKNCNGVASDAAAPRPHQLMSRPTVLRTFAVAVVTVQHRNPVPSPARHSRSVLGPRLGKGSHPARSIRKSWRI